MAKYTLERLDISKGHRMSLSGRRKTSKRMMGNQINLGRKVTRSARINLSKAIKKWWRRRKSL